MPVNLRNAGGLGGSEGCVWMAWNSCAPLFILPCPPSLWHSPASWLLRLKKLVMLKCPDQTDLVSCGASAAVGPGTPFQAVVWVTPHPAFSCSVEMENGRSLCPRSGKCSWFKISFSFFLFGRLAPFCKEDELGLEEIRCVYLVCNIFVLQIATF